MLLAPSLAGYIARIHENCAKDTSYDPNGWAPRKPTWGHCLMISLLTQELYGGEILNASLLHSREFGHMESHFMNQLPGGALLDLTAAQFGATYPSFEWKIACRMEALRDSATLARYAVFRARFEELAKRIWLREHLIESFRRGMSSQK